MNLFRRLLRENRGVVAVEFALFLPVFLLLTFGIIELGAAWYQKQMLVSASREGARMATLYSEDGITAQEVEARVNEYLTQGGFPGQPTVQVTGVDGATGDAVTVNITSPYNLPVLSAITGSVAGTINLSATTVMRHE